MITLSGHKIWWIADRIGAAYQGSGLARNRNASWSGCQGKSGIRRVRIAYPRRQCVVNGDISYSTDAIVFHLHGVSDGVSGGGGGTYI